MSLETRPALPATRKRDVFAIGAAVFLMLCFSFYFFVFTGALARAGSLLVIMSAAWICYKLLRTKRMLPGENSGSTLIRQELQDLQKQSSVLKKALVFHVVPLLAGFNLFCQGLPRPGAYKLIFLLVTVTVCLTFYWLGQRRLTGQIRHLRAEIERFGK